MFASALNAAVAAVTRSGTRQQSRSKVMSTTNRTHRCRAWSALADFAGLFEFLRTLADSYRPELHYMRGPGPKWRAKHRPPV